MAWRRRLPQRLTEKGLRSPRPILVEFEPLAANELRSGALRTLGIGGVASLALILMAAFLWRLTLRAERVQEERERERRLASLGELAAVISHEIRNPLTSMKGHAQLLAEHLEAGSRDRDKAERVVREAVRLEKLASDLLSLVRSEKIERSDVDPARLLREAAESVDPERIELVLDGAPALWSVDAERMLQVLTNLLRNAVQASPESARPVAEVSVEEDRLVFTVRDFGDGIPEGEEERIFEPFYTTRVQGTGLGLAVARRVVALHGGTITAANHPQGGAVLRVAVPA
jgi:two-component system sensor histidine kinase HydH